MNDIFLTLKLPYNNTSMKSGCDKVSISFRQKHICYVITLICKLFILKQNLAIKFIQTQFFRTPRKNDILIFINF